MYKLLQAIEAFQKDPPTTVFLLSMRAGSVGINLTAASHVFLLEPCINPALEEQVQLLEGQGARSVQVYPLAHPSMCLPSKPAGSAAQVVVLACSCSLAGGLLLSKRAFADVSSQACGLHQPVCAAL